MEAKNDSWSTERDLLRMFVRDVNRWPLLSREEEAAIAHRARAGDQAAADLLIESNLRIVLKAVFTYWYPGISVMDMISAGCMILVRASKTFDPNMGASFCTYVWDGVHGSVRTVIRSHYKHRHDSLDDPVYDDSEETTRKDLLISDDPGADEMVFGGQIRKMLSDLDEREQRILILRFWGDLTLEEAGVRIGLSKDRARQIENRALRKLRWTRRVDFGEDRGEPFEKPNMKVEVEA
jgi:RNA polymerase sigma factor (sigma-70 family)